MKAIVLVSICLALLVVLTEVNGLRKRPSSRRWPAKPRTTLRPPHHGWRHTNGTCICQGPSPSPMNGPRPSHGPHGHRGPRPSHGPHGHHGPRPSHGPHGHHGPRPSHGPHGHHGPRPSHGPHGHHGPRPSHGPHGHHIHHPTRHHGHHGPRPTGHHGHRCICRKSEMTVEIHFRMMKEFSKDLNDCKSLKYRKMSNYITTKLKKVLKEAKHFTKVKFFEGSVIVNVGAVYDVNHKEDPEKALKNAIHDGEMKDMGVYPDSLSTSHSYSGVTLSQWKPAVDQCSKCERHGRHGKDRHHQKGHHKHHKDDRKHKGDHHKDDHKKDDDHRNPTVLMMRTCIEVEASCDGIPLTRNASCEEGCHEPPKIGCWLGWARRHKYVTISCVAAVVVVIIVIIATIVKVKKSRKKYVKTSPSTSSIKELAKNDELQKELQFSSKC